MGDQYNRKLILQRDVRLVGLAGLVLLETSYSPVFVTVAALMALAALLLIVRNAPLEAASGATATPP